MLAGVFMSESRVVDAIESMLSKPDFLFPFIAAQRQYRDHYYGLTAAALLEYYFIDMLSYYLSVHESGKKLETPSHGQREWDYELDGIQVSHKVGEKISQISGLWDATWTPKDGLYSFSNPIVYSIVNYTNLWGTLEIAGLKLNIASLSQCNRGLVDPGQRVLLVGRSNKEWEVLKDIINTGGEKTYISNLLSFKDIWQSNSRTFNEQANSIEMFVVKKLKENENLPNLQGSKGSIDFKFLPGLYFLRKEQLQNIKVTKNNRSNVLVPTDIVKEKMHSAFNDELFVYMPSWFSAYSVSRPPDLYLSQKKSYDDLFKSELHR